MKLPEKLNNDGDSLALLPSVRWDLECAFLISFLGNYVPNSPYTPIWKTGLELSWSKASSLEGFVTELPEHWNNRSKWAKCCRQASRAHNDVNFMCKWRHWRIMSWYARGMTDCWRGKVLLGLRQRFPTPYEIEKAWLARENKVEFTSHF